MVIRHMLRGNSEVRRGAVPHKEQVKEIASLVGRGRVLQGEVEGME